MEDLQELTNQIDNIKEKLTDKEYKDLIELTQKINSNKKMFVKCLVGTIKLNIYEKSDEEDIEINIIGNLYTHIGYDQGEEHRVHVSPNIKFEEKILEVKEEIEVEGYSLYVNNDANFMCNALYELIKATTYHHFKFPDNKQCDIIVYLGDL